MEQERPSAARGAEGFRVAEAVNKAATRLAYNANPRLLPGPVPPAGAAPSGRNTALLGCRAAAQTCLTVGVTMVCE